MLLRPEEMPPGRTANAHRTERRLHIARARNEATTSDEAGHAHAEMLRRWRWRDVVIITLGIWLVATPPTIGYHDTWMFWNDIISGGLIVVFGLIALSPRFDLVRWALCATGIWLLFAPLVFWARDPGAYATDTMVGALVITFSVLVPMMPGRTHHQVMAMAGPDTPPDWSYNPSDWFQRGPIIAMAFLGFFISRYLAAFQLGHIGPPWDPFFGDGTRRVLYSDISKAWPISDAGLGAVSYMLEALSGFMGGRNRWRTMPWMVLLFGVLVVPLGIVTIVLVVLQPIAVGSWCTLCLVTAAAMLIMISPAMDEVVAMCQFLMAARAEGKPLWRTFWVGGTLEAHRTTPGSEPPRRSTVAQIVSAFDLNTVPWNLLTTAALGVWVMAAPAVLGGTGAAANNDHLVGALIVTWSVIALGEVARPARLLNVPCGIWLALAPWIVLGDTNASRLNDVLVGIAIVALSLRRGAITQRFAGWNRFLV